MAPPYALIAPDNSVRPSYFLAALLAQLLPDGVEVLDSRGAGPQQGLVRAHAYHSPGSQSCVVSLINLRPTSQAVRVCVAGNASSMPNTWLASAYRLGPGDPANPLTSTSLRVNGKALTPNQDGTLPPMPPVSQVLRQSAASPAGQLCYGDSAGAPLTMPAYGIELYRLPRVG